jgi:hypothetical protein
MNRITSTLVFVLFFSLCHPSFSQQQVKKAPRLRFLVHSALEFGGDKIAELYFTNGEKQGVRAGQGISVGAGAQLQISGADKFLLRASVGFKYVTTAADNVHVRLTRVPIIASGSFMASPRLRLGAGLCMHRGIRFNTGGLGNDESFQGANGPVFEIAYAGVGLSYTAMKYVDRSGNSYSANAVGITYSIVFPGK